MEKLDKNEYKPYGAFKKLVEVFGSIPTPEEFMEYTDYKKSTYYKYRKQFLEEEMLNGNDTKKPE